ncbi:MAG: DNA polymerase III subunit alpha [candidate division BRC1 bacterium ADurb.BinA364]|nr:MAG: DNA polymerase III subunit alpha [candidate division BRC1 bacterium ADurb.BinA364]
MIAPLPTNCGDACRAQALRDLNDLDALAHDPRTIDLIRSGRTMGCFYIESPAMRSLLKRLDCSTYEMVVAASSIIRPGVAESGMMQAFIERHFDPSKIEYAHPALEETLYETYGVMIYQEDVLRVACRVGGLTLGEADLLRRAISAKGRGKETMDRLTAKFFASCRRGGIAEETAAEIWRQIASFASYSFCKGHSAAFAVLSFQCAYIKARWPAEFLASVLNNGGGFYGPAAYIQEARRFGLRVLGPDVNRSERRYTGDSAEGWLRVGLKAIRGMTRERTEPIVRARRERPYAGLEDFLARSGAGQEEARTLILAGALDCFGQTRPQLSLDLDLCFGQRPAAGQPEMFA